MLHMTRELRVLPLLLAAIGEERRPWEHPDLGEVTIQWGHGDRARLARLATVMVGVEYGACDDCDEIVPAEDATSIAGGTRTVCDSCREDYAWCEDCEEYVDQTDITSVGNRWVCTDCLENYSHCDDCGEYVDDDVQAVGDSYVCDGCIDSYSYCDECEEYYRPGYGDHNHGCDCEAPRRRFLFPADGAGTIREDVRLEVQLPAGTIDAEGMTLIARLVWGNSDTTWDDAHKVVDEVGPTWQTKRGNFTRRLSSALYKHNGTKLDAATVSEVGNLARAHSSDDASWAIEVTRNLNLPARDFGNEGSCWWEGYAVSRCCLKSWGGIGLRTYDRWGEVSGRAWVQPVRVTDDGDILPTHDAITADGYVAFNGYGELAGYTAARVVAHLAGMTYRKIAYSIGADTGRYVNNGSGYLIGVEPFCSAHDAITFDLDAHDHCDAATVEIN